MMNLLFVVCALQAVGWCLTVIALRSAHRANISLADRNAAQAQSLAMYRRQDDMRACFEAECG